MASFWKAGHVARYHLYYLKQGMLVGSDAIDAADESEAEELAAERSDGRTVEVWDATRRVLVIPASTVRRVAAAIRT